VVGWRASHFNTNNSPMAWRRGREREGESRKVRKDRYFAQKQRDGDWVYSEERQCNQCKGKWNGAARALRMRGSGKTHCETRNRIWRDREVQKPG